MLAKPRWLLDRDAEWLALGRMLERRQRLALVYGPRRVGKSFLLDAVCEASGGHRYQAITGLRAAQLDDFGTALGEWLGAGPLRVDGWADAIARLARVESPVIVIDELPYLSESAPELAGVLQRYVDGRDGPPLVLAGSSLSTMTELIAPRAPLFGRAAAVVVPAPFTGPDLRVLWQIGDPRAALWVDATVGGLPGYRPLLAPPGDDLDAWMVEEVLAASSPLLDAAEAALTEFAHPPTRGVYRTILGAIAGGERTFGGIARVAGLPSGALSRPLSALERAGLIVRVPDPLRSRRDTYDLADPHLRTWLAVIEPQRSALQAGRARDVWDRVRDATWRAQVLGPRWESGSRSHLAVAANDLVGPVDAVGTTAVSDRTARVSHEVDIVAVRGRTVAALGEAKLRQLGGADLERLQRIRDLLGAPDARLVLASVSGVDDDVASTPGVVTISPADVYG